MMHVIAARLLQHGRTAADDKVLTQVLCSLFQLQHLAFWATWLSRCCLADRQSAGLRALQQQLFPSVALLAL